MTEQDVRAFADALRQNTTLVSLQCVAFSCGFIVCSCGALTFEPFGCLGRQFGGEPDHRGRRQAARGCAQVEHHAAVAEVLASLFVFSIVCFSFWRLAELPFLDSLANNQIGPEGARSFAELLRENTTLKELKWVELFIALPVHARGPEFDLISLFSWLQPAKQLPARRWGAPHRRGSPGELDADFPHVRDGGSLIPKSLCGLLRRVLVFARCALRQFGRERVRSSGDGRVLAGMLGEELVSAASEVCLNLWFWCISC